MGQAATKHTAGGTDTLELLEAVCDGASRLAAAKCGKNSAAQVFKQVAVLQDGRQLLEACCEQEAAELQGHQVFAVAAALQQLNTHLQWCLSKLEHQRRAVSMHTRRQHAAHVLEVLAAAREAHQHFSTAFSLAVVMSRQQQHEQSLPTQQVQVQEAAAAPLQLKSDAGTTPPTPAAETRLEQPATGANTCQCIINDRQQQQQQLSCVPVADSKKLSVTGQGSVTAAAHAPSVPPSAEEAALPAAAESESSSTASSEAEEQEGTAEDTASLHDSQQSLWADDDDDADWDALLQRAWRGDEAAVLACAQELIQGGDFCLQDFSLARQLLLTTIPNGCATACLWLGELSEHGLGVNPMTAPLDPWEEAAAWYGQGAALGDLKCAHALAYCYQHGLGISQDTQAAMEWYEFAAEGGLAASQNNLGHLLLLLQSPTTSHSGVDSCKRGSAAAVKLLERAADQGSTAAHYNVKVCHELGLAGEGGDDVNSAATGVQKKADAQHAAGAVCWQEGRVDDALQLWHAAAAQGCDAALMCLAAAADKGLQGVEKNPAAARACYAAAAQLGCPQAGAQLSALDQQAALQSWQREQRLLV